MKKSRKKHQHKCSGKVEYRHLLYIYNPNSANYFGLHPHGPSPSGGKAMNPYLAHGLLHTK